MIMKMKLKAKAKLAIQSSAKPVVVAAAPVAEQDSYIPEKVKVNNGFIAAHL